MEFKVMTRKWGNSIAVVIPKEVAEKRRIKEDEKIVITVEKEKPTAGDFLGMLKGELREPTQKIKDDMRKGWYSASDKGRWR